MRDAMIDYGALQSRPIQAKASNLIDSTVRDFALLDNSLSTPTQTSLSEASPDPAALRTDSATSPMTLSHESIRQHLNPQDLDLFDDSLIVDADLNAAFAGVTQEFWASLPGEIEFSEALRTSPNP